METTSPSETVDRSVSDFSINGPSLPTTDKIRNCPYCSRQFKKNDHYDRHVRSHTNEKPFGCKICGKFYPRRDTLLRHLKTHQGRRRNRWSGSMRAPIAGPRYYSVDVDFDLTAAGDCDDSLTPISSYQSARRDSNANLTSPTATARARQHSLSDDMVESGPAFPYTGTTLSDSRTNPDSFPGFQIPAGDSNVDNSIFVDPLLQFDASNWLLDENLIDIENVVATWTEPRQLIERPTLKQSHAARESNAHPAVLDLRPIWYTQLRRDLDDLHDEGVVGAGRSMANPVRRDIDEGYRCEMDETLHPRLRDDPLPSNDVLNLCIHLFFTRFNVTLPIIHGPTFRPSASNVLLVLLMCSAGAMTMTSDLGTRISCRLFESALKAGNSDSWERNISEQPLVTRNHIKGAIIGQTLACLSGDTAHRVIADAYLGAIISLGRHVNLFEEFPEIDLGDVDSPEDLDRLWKRWACYEEMKRALVLLHIHDAEIAALFHHEPIFRHNTSRVPAVAPAELFQAPTAAAWAIKYRMWQRNNQYGETNEMHVDHPDDCDKSSVRPPSPLNSWAALSSIGATICETRYQKRLDPRCAGEIEGQLLRWYSSAQVCCRGGECHNLQTSELPFCLRPLWHHHFMSLTTNFDLLERSVGRQGPNVATSVLEQVRAWASSPESKRCLVHALCVQSMARSTTLGAADAMHAARILFAAALCWHAYIIYSPGCDGAASSASSVPPLPDETAEYLAALPETRLLREAGGPVPTVMDKAISDLKRILSTNPAEMKASTLCVLESTLRRLGTNGIAWKYANLVQAFVTGQVG